MKSMGWRWWMGVGAGALLAVGCAHRESTESGTPEAPMTNGTPHNGTGGASGSETSPGNTNTEMDPRSGSGGSGFDDELDEGATGPTEGNGTGSYSTGNSPTDSWSTTDDLNSPTDSNTGTGGSGTPSKPRKPVTPSSPPPAPEGAVPPASPGSSGGTGN